jgi:glutaconate CoA-transferase, subunit B
MASNNQSVKSVEYRPIDMLAAAASREVRDNDVVFAGTGLPMLAIMLAQHNHAPNATCIYEAGTIDGNPIDLPASVGDARCCYQASIVSGLVETMFGQLHCGYVDTAFLGGAEIDQYGNVNTTVIGDYNAPKKRLTGSGGNPDINGLARRTVFIMIQEKRRFKEHVDYITSPGWRIRKWPGGNYLHKKEVYGKYFHGGPDAVITNMGVFRFDENGIMFLDTVHPGFTVEQVKDNVSFELNISRVKGETTPPTQKEIELLYNVVDPEGIFLS